MPTYFVAATGSNTAPYSTWATAATSLATALAAANAAGDIVVIQFDGVPATDNALAADTTYTFAAQNVALISASNDGGSSWTPTVMGTANWIGSSTANRAITLAGAFRTYIYGVTFRTAGATADNITLGATDGSHQVLEDCYLWSGNTTTGARISIGQADAQTFVHLINCTLRFGNASQLVELRGKALFEGGSITSAGTIPTAGMIATNAVDPGGCTADFEGFDFTAMGANAMIGNCSAAAARFTLSRCKLGTSFVVLATQTNLNRSSAEAWLFDCAVGDTHGLFGYYDAMGSAVSNTTIFFTSGAAAQSWVITTTANCNFVAPFRAPWVDLYHTGTSAITPFFEILRDGSATAYQNDEVWAEFSAKVTSGVVTPTFYRDRKTLQGAAADQDAGAGLGSWTGESGTAWSGKCDSGSAFTPAEAGHIRGRLVVGEPSITVYLDPQIRT